MKRYLAIAAFMSGGVLALSGPMVVYKAWADGWCCETVSSYEGCFGCVAAGDGYVHVGSNPVRTCESTPLSQECSGAPEACYELKDTPLFSDAQCTTKRGFKNVTNYVSLCHLSDDACGGG